MGRPPDRNDNDRNAWGQPPAPRGWRPESRPLRVARTVRDMFTRGPKRQPQLDTGQPSAPVPATPAWLNSPPPPQSTVAGMERSANTSRGGPGRGPSSQPQRYDGPPPREQWDPGRGGPVRGPGSGPFGPPDRGGPAGPIGPRMGGEPGGAPPRWQPPEWLPSQPPAEGYQGGPMGGSGYQGPGGYEGFDAPFGSSGEYGSYGPPPGSNMPYAQNAPEYVPPLTAKTPAAVGGPGGWSGAQGPGQQDAYGAHGAGGASPPDLSRGPASLAHAGSSSSTVSAGEYVPGGSGVPLWEQAPTPAFTASAGSTPYYWESAARAKRVPIWAVAARWLVTLALLLVSFFGAAYAGFSAYAASTLVYAPQVVPQGSPADYKMDYKSVAFTSRTDHVALEGWFIPGVDAQGKETDARTIIMVHGTRTNRADVGVGMLPLEVALAKSGFAILAFDMRGAGLSQADPLSLGYFEQRDVLGAVDFLKSGEMPYPALGRPKAIGGWGVSMGAATLLMAAAQDKDIKAVVSDSAYSDIMPILEREIPKRSGLPGWFTPGVLKAVQVMYGIDFSKVRPVDVVQTIAPRPILFIQGSADTYVPTSDLDALATAAQQGSGSVVSTWSVPNAKHAQAYHVAGQAYVTKLVDFFTTNLTLS